MRKRENEARATREGARGPPRDRLSSQTKVVKSEKKDVLGMGRHERIRKRESPVHTLDFP